jgi:imidazoleglycerol phosphate synthase cyclase subunit
MLAVRIIPCLDVSNGRVVKGVRFQGLRDAGDPAELAEMYETQGADELVFLDVSATPEGRDTQTRTVELVRERVSIPITVGGGVRQVEDARRLLNAGADKVSMNTAAVTDPTLVTLVAEQFGRQCTVVAIDAKRDDSGWEVVTRGGRNPTGIDAVGWAREAVERGAGELLVTSWDRDGTRSGYDLELLDAISSKVRVPVIASGGANGSEHLKEALDHGASAVLAASIFHDGDMTVADVKTELAAMGVLVRDV